MKIRIGAALAAISILLAGCVTPPQLPVALAEVHPAAMPGGSASR